MPEEKRKSNGGLWMIVFAGLVAIVFILLNSQDVKIKFLFATTSAPLFFALAISTVLGLVVGYLVGRFRGPDR